MLPNWRGNVNKGNIIKAVTYNWPFCFSYWWGWVGGWMTPKMWMFSEGVGISRYLCSICDKCCHADRANWRIWLISSSKPYLDNVKQRIHEKTLLLLFHFLNSLELACGTQMLWHWGDFEIPIASCHSTVFTWQKKRLVERKLVSWL